MPELVQRFPVAKEYEKNPDISPEDIKKLRQWLETQPHLPRQHLDDLDLLLVFHCCGGSAEVSKQVLDLHFTLRTLFTIYFQDRRLDARADHALDTILYAPLPTPTVEGYRAVYLRLLDPDPRRFNFADAVRTFMMVFDLWQHEEGTWPGFILLIDLDQAVLGHLGRLDIINVKEVLYFLQECMVVKLKGLHFLNAPSFMDKLMMMLRPFMKKELLDLLYIHQSNSETLYKHIPKAAFPKEEGGSYKDRSTIKDEMIKKLKANEEFFEKENLRRVEESRRPEGKTNLGDQFGIQGSFKKLSID